MTRTLEDLTFARAIFLWAVLSHRMRWVEHKELMRSVIAQERKLVGCSGKEGFGSFDQAKAVADRRRGKDGHKRRNAYRCDLCGGWHLADAKDWREKRMMKGRALA
jgi:hypothetical protein